VRNFAIPFRKGNHTTINLAKRVVGVVFESNLATKEAQHNRERIFAIQN
jgi:hypothetical protein